jgi:hypothetical protein
MKYTIVKNEKRNTLSVVLSPIVFTYTKFLYEKYNEQKYFASGILENQDYNADILPFVKDLVKHLNELGSEILPAGETFNIADIITLNEGEYRLLTKNIDKDGQWNKQFKINLSSKTKKADKKFLFTSLDESEVIDELDSRNHRYGVEIELGIGYNEDNLEKYIYAVFHRAISIGKKDQQNDNNYKSNDSAWSGFDFGGSATKDDLPF